MLGRVEEGVGTLLVGCRAGVAQEGTNAVGG